METATSLHLNNPPKLVGREHLVAVIFETLLRIEKPNVVLTGAPGVGKTAIVEHIKHLIESQQAPVGLLEYKVKFLNLNDLLAGPGYRGSFEQRCKDVFREYLGTSTILFMDEFHVAENMGAMADGQAPGFGNFLKPIITSNDIRIIGATTDKEYDDKMTDMALKRRFRRIKVDEPSEEQTKQIILERIERFNIEKKQVKEVPGLVEHIYQISTKLAGFNPDKSVDLTDLLFAKARLNSDAIISEKLWKNYLSEIYNRKKDLEKYEL